MMSPHLEVQWGKRCAHCGPGCLLQHTRTSLSRTAGRRRWSTCWGRRPLYGPGPCPSLTRGTADRWWWSSRSSVSCPPDCQPSWATARDTRVIKLSLGLTLGCPHHLAGLGLYKHIKHQERSSNKSVCNTISTDSASLNLKKIFSTKREAIGHISLTQLVAINLVFLDA